MHPTFPKLKHTAEHVGFFFMGWMPTNGEPIQLNGAFYVNIKIHSGIGGGGGIRLSLSQLSGQYNFLANIGRPWTPQPKTPVHCDNVTAVGIANNTVKRQRSQGMEMRFFGMGDKVAQEMYDMAWYPGQENLAEYQSKHHIGTHQVAVRPWYLHTEDSPQYLPRAVQHSTLKGCVGTLKDGYI